MQVAPPYRARLKIVPRFQQFAIVVVRPTSVEVLRVTPKRDAAIDLAQRICEAATAAGMPTVLE